MKRRMAAGATAVLAIAGGASIIASGDSASASIANSVVQITPSKVVTLAGYHGPEAALPSGYKIPKIKHGVTFTLGYLNPSQGVQALDQSQAGATNEAKKLGGSTIALNVNADPSTQVADFGTLLTDNVTALNFQPLNPAALASDISQAQAKGIPIIAQNTPAVANQPSLPGYDSDILQGVDMCTYLNAKAVATVDPHATYALIGTTLPYPSLTALQQRQVYWANKLGLKYQGEVSTGMNDTPISGSTAMASVLAQWPKVKVVFVWTDEVAQGVATTARADGSHILVLGSNGSTAAIQLVQSRIMFATCKQAFTRMGVEGAIGAYDELTKQHLPLPPKIVVKPTEITAVNAAHAVSG